MRVTTLKASADRVGGLLAYYAGLAEDRDRPGPARGPVDYYLDPDEPPGRWWGDGCGALGLAGPVAGPDLRSLLEASHPGTGEALGRRFGDASARGFDPTFSAPKSVSVLWALSPYPWVRAEVLAAHDAAVEAAMGWFQRHGALTRRGRDGVLQVDALGITAALFRQHTSRTIGRHRRLVMSRMPVRAMRAPNPDFRVRALGFESMANAEAEVKRRKSGSNSLSGLLTSAGFLVYAAVAWAPCLILGVIVGAAISMPPAEDGVIQGRGLGMTAAFPEIAAFTILFLVLAYVTPALYLNRERASRGGRIRGWGPQMRAGSM
ncbi:MAG: relaxase domain-containing protein [Actinobacteria bacterium]|nr:relaxase domain-containing protein [Actinomycetota bacterium]